MAALTPMRGYIAGAAYGTLFGLSLGLIVADKVMRPKYERIVENQIDEMRIHYQRRQKALAEQEKPDLEKLVQEAGYKIETKYSPAEVKAISDVVEEEEHEAQEEEVDEDTEDVEEHNVFSPVDGLPEWDYTEENARRIFTRPYVIHKDEFDEGVSSQDPQIPDYEQSTLTYFEEDDVLADERDNVIDPAERDMLIGDDNLRRFGHGSGDPNVVYIRNNQIKNDIELLRNTGSFAVQVHGFIQHMEPRRRARLKFDDE